MGAHGDANGVTIDVHNMGRAIEPAVMKTIFDPLTRQSGDADNERLGRGLYIARQIALAHEGSIDVSSTRDAGTRSTVRLPRQPTLARTA